MQRSLLLMLLFANVSAADRLLLETESFQEHGGWKLDTQFIDIMGSPYLLAHGLGRPVEDATTSVEFPSAGAYHVYARSIDWVARWEAPGSPGRFQILVNGIPLEHEFGAQGKDWIWEYGGQVTLNEKELSVRLHDLTGFDGRCDAIYFSKQKTPPPSDSEILPGWRRELLNLPNSPSTRNFDLVVIGGGYSGMGTALSACADGMQGGADSESARLGRQRVERGSRLVHGSRPPRQVSADRRDRRRVLRQCHEVTGPIRRVRG